MTVHTATSTWINHHKTALLLAICTLFTLISWSGLLDQLVLDDINNSLKDAAILFGLARGLNAGISMLQTIEISPVVASIGIGEVLDPLNDFVERFSAVITIALASLAGQKVLLAATSTHLFNLLITSALLLFTFSLGVAKTLVNQAFRLFLVLAFIRLSLALVIVANLLVDMALFQVQEEQYTQQVLTLESEINQNAESLTASEAQFEQQLKELRQQQAEITAQEQQFTTSLARQQQELDSLEEQLDAIKSQNSTLQRLNPLKEHSTEEQALHNAISELEAAEQADKQMLEELGEREEVLKEELECIETRKNGGSCSLGEWFTSKTNIGSMKDKISSMAAAIERSIESFIYLIAIVIMKSIILPLLFWVMVYHSVKRLWQLDIKTLLNSTPERSPA